MNQMNQINYQNYKCFARKSKKNYEPMILILSDILRENILSTSKFLSEARILASFNPQYDHRLFIELQVQYMKIPSSEPGKNMLCTKIVSDIQNNSCAQHVLPIFLAFLIL